MNGARPGCTVNGTSQTNGRSVSETIPLHTAVAATLLRHNMVLHHWNEDKYNNHANNLVWLTEEEHKFVHKGIRQLRVTSDEILEFIDVKHVRPWKKYFPTLPMYM
ncbi:unnamed protein product [Mucor fragilis]